MSEQGEKTRGKHTLQNHGETTVRFSGESVAQESTKTGQEDQEAWCDMELFRTDGGNFVATVCLMTREEDRENVRKVFVEDDQKRISSLFAPKAADFLKLFAYFEPGRRHDFDAAVSRLFDSAEIFRDVE